MSGVGTRSQLDGSEGVSSCVEFTKASERVLRITGGSVPNHGEHRGTGDLSV